ncbi:serine hydrolase domain-containing protein [Flavobacterium frigoris]|uniref:CubicO group peptidase, beta-lactamase class C family n=1 Tax=Flavobacterium frigoris TaxID=229204 RepID=A0A1H9P0F1_FLAFI|nr:serine hydrolase domain-containing protein [Flavobacterium frigoris]SER41299.1 CubicO group peptidase, beta-lactamase class C family [Flavobacterium frigoris]
MIFIKKANILQILLLLLVLSSCKQKKILEIDTDLKTPIATPIVIQQGPKLTPAYIESKKNSIIYFYNKNWPNKSANGGFLVAKNGQIIYEKYEGLANYKEKSAMTSTTPLHIASVSKVITATAILKLVSVKKLYLEQKVTTILKEFPYPDVTIRTLLTHRSGMRNYAYFTEKKGIWDRHKILSNQDILTIMATKDIDLEFRTNSRFSYCNTNYAMLALIIEKVTGLEYKDAMKEIVFKPLGMTNTYVFDYEKDKLTAVPSYKRNFAKVNLDYLDAIYGDKNIYSTPRDLLKFDNGRNSAAYLDQKLLQEAYVGYSNEHRGTKNYGLGIRMINWPTGKNFYFHNGWWHGNTASYVTLPEEKVTIIALSNKYDKRIYKVRKLAALFGDYPFHLEDNEKEE